MIEIIPSILSLTQARLYHDLLEYCNIIIAIILYLFKWKYFTRSLHLLGNYFPTPEENFCISKQPYNVLSYYYWVVPKNFPPPPPHPQRMGFWKFLQVGGVEDSGNPGGRGGWTWKSLLPGSFRLIDNAIRTFSSVPLQRSQTLEIAEISCSHISHLT